MHEIQVSVLFFAAARDAAQTDNTVISLMHAATLADLRDILLQQWPELRKFGPSLLWAVNAQYANPDLPLHDGDTVACFPPVSGG